MYVDADTWRCLLQGLLLARRHAFVFSSAGHGVRFGVPCQQPCVFSISLSVFHGVGQQVSKSKTEKKCCRGCGLMGDGHSGRKQSAGNLPAKRIHTLFFLEEGRRPLRAELRSLSVFSQSHGCFLLFLDMEEGKELKEGISLAWD